MNKAQSSNGDSTEEDDLLPEYRLDYSKAKPNRFAPQQPDGSLVVILEPDIAKVFTTPDAVKKVLRALIATMPGTPAT
jgi:hypothetical protein